ncbi:hypothetical protein [Streptomyces oceani]|uniref:Uncharacterized protein n=1 Tax=Streptomyces oceani TaxID=1075402 RepID=A0A1E7KMB5_9ACTN|nr:hypothetical protein [Streptomyces oceani]OEV05050.1 hypothetical protein AN216_04730 [Streptomyces oceani]
MGFDLNCVLTLHDDVLPLYDLLVPGGSGHALRTSGPGLPDAWALPNPWELECGTDGAYALRPGALAPADLDAWRADARIPEEPDPLDAFDTDDLLLGSLLSLGAPVLLLNDRTFGGVLGHEYAALLAGGELLAAHGVDFGKRTAFALEDSGGYRTTDPATAAPTTRCAELLDDRFRGRFLFDGYLPRAAHREGDPCRAAHEGPQPDVDPSWARHFPPLLSGG